MALVGSKTNNRTVGYEAFRKEFEVLVRSLTDSIHNEQMSR